MKLTTHHHILPSLGMIEVVNLHSVGPFMASTGTQCSAQNELRFISPAPGFAELHFSVAADPVPESLGNRVISTTERNLYRECLMSSSGMSSGISITNTVKIFCGRQGIGTWNEWACISV